MSASHPPWPPCAQCKSPRVHRHKRSAAQKLFGYLVPLRPLRCASCQAVQWRRLPLRQAPLNYLSSLGVWGVLLVLIFDTSHQAPDGLPSANPSEPPALQEDAIAPEAASPASPAAVQAPEARPALTLAPSLSDTLSEVTVTFGPEGALVELHAGRPIDPPELTRSPAAGGFILDIPGRWTVAGAVAHTRHYERRHLREISIGEHADYLRVVFRVTELRSTRPSLETSAEGIRVSIPSP